MKSATYVLLIAGCYLFPFVFTLIHKRMLRKEKYHILNLSVLISAVPFIIWDYIAAYRGYWTFNKARITGFYAGLLPIEEIIFFLLIPQASLLIWIAFTKYDHPSQFIAGLLKHFKHLT